MTTTTPCRPLPGRGPNGVAAGGLTAGYKHRRFLKAGLVPLFCLLLLMTLTAFSPAQAAITQVGTPTYYSNNWWSYTLQLNVPSGIQVGDVLIAQVSAVTTDTINDTITPPSGWTEIRTDSMTVTVQQSRWYSYSYNIIQGVYYRVVDGTEGSHYTWTTNFSGNAMGGGITAFRGVDPSNPIDASGGQTNTSSRTITAPSITANATGDALIGLFSDDDGQHTINVPNSMSQLYSQAQYSNYPTGLSYAGGWETLGSSGATGTRDATISNRDNGIGQLVALRPINAAITPTGVINTYYPGTASVNTGATSITLGPATGATVPISSGDLVLIMQMQDATINYDNSDSYGDGTSDDKVGTGATTIRGSGLFEYAVADSDVPLSGGTLSLPCGTVNAYTNSDATSTDGQHRFQVIRVPVYSNTTLSSSVTASPWNGSTGGVLALDDTGTLDLNSATVSVDGDGFRGGAARNSSSGSGSASDFVTPVTNGANGTKGEGIAGTPYYVFTAPSTMTDTGIDGYPNGSFARGAPANAGGGGTDIDPRYNDENSGGGGGANGGSGGLGGIGWCPTFTTTSPYYGCGLSSLMVTSINPHGSSGGFGGSAVSGLGSARLTLGGGGGSGTTNNGTGDLPNGLATSGVAGGGIIMIRAAALSGSGTFDANGNDGDSTVDNDGGGGGGAGGAVLISAGSGLSGVTINANGGNGGSTVVSHSYTPHGPGGGGGGGFAITTSATATCSVTGGQYGTTYDYNNFFGAYGASSGSGGSCLTGLASGDIPGATLGGAGACPSRVASFLIDPGTSPASTCAPRNVTITAQSSSGTTLTNYTGTISISTSSGHGDWSLASGNGTFTAGASDSGTATYTFSTGDSGTVTLSLADTHADDLTITVNDSSASVTSTSSPALSFRDNVFVITPLTCTGSTDCGTSPPTGSDTVVANRPHIMQAALWTKDPTSGLCSVNTSYDATAVKGWYTLDANNPTGASSGTYAPAINDGTKNVQLTTAAPGSNNLALTFNSGVATFTLRTTDVGKYTLSLLDDSSKFAKDASGNARSITGSSATLTVRPFAIDLRDVKLSGGTTNPGATISPIKSGNSTQFTSAGSDFEGTAAGVLWDSAYDTKDTTGNAISNSGNGVAEGDGIPDPGISDTALNSESVTPHYAWKTTITAATPITPSVANDGTLGTLSNGTLASTAFSGGSATATTLEYSDVGSVTLEPIPDGSYLGSSVSIPYVSVVVGRFCAYDFNVTLGAGQFKPADGVFTYLGQSFYYGSAPSITIVARNKQGGTLKNYEGDFWLLDRSGIPADPTLANGFSYTDLGGKPLVPPTTTIPLGDFSTVHGDLTVNKVHSTAPFSYTRPATPIAPYDADVQLSVTLKDKVYDGTTSNTATTEMGFSSDGYYSTPPDASILTTDDKTLRWGRVALQNANGPELADLQVPMEAEYYSGYGFVPNTDDSSSTLQPSSPLSTYLQSSDVQNSLITKGTTCVVGTDATSGYSCNSSISGEDFTATAASGLFTLYFKAPGTNMTGSFDVKAYVPAWLQYSWPTISSLSDNKDPVARVTFGIYKGNPKDIYLRELY